MQETQNNKKRQAGVLMPLSALPSLFGVGDLGPQSYQFVDMLAQSGVSVWQLLPLNPLGYGNSPYQPYSSYAGDPLYISPELLLQQRLLQNLPEPLPAAGRVDYPAAQAYKEKICRRAFERFVPDGGYQRFAALPWVYSYAVFITLKKANGLRCWLDWPEEQRNWPYAPEKLDLTPYENDIGYEIFAQYLFYSQWQALKAYANGKGVQMMGDLPIYVGLDSQDVWSARDNFLLDAAGHPTVVAGVPPDYFSPTGQRWGNPIYDWDRMQKDGFRFWVERLSYAVTLFDILRIDHFRAFDTYWRIPAECSTAQQGEWVEAPGYALLDTIREKLPQAEIVAEDLGDLRPEVYTLRDHYGFAGMRIVQFTMEPGEDEKQTGDRENLIVYTGTHDNQTIAGWYASKTPCQRWDIRAILHRHGCDTGTPARRLVEYALKHRAYLAVIPVQDIIGLGDEARMNTPGTLGSPNWEWRLDDYEQLRLALPWFTEAVRESGRAPH